VCPLRVRDRERNRENDDKKCRPCSPSSSCLWPQGTKAIRKACCQKHWNYLGEKWNFHLFLKPWSKVVWCMYLNMTVSLLDFWFKSLSFLYILTRSSATVCPLGSYFYILNVHTNICRNFSLRWREGESSLNIHINKCTSTCSNIHGYIGAYSVLMWQRFLTKNLNFDIDIGPHSQVVLSRV
jgi:hypothetical protein